MLVISQMLGFTKCKKATFVRPRGTFCVDERYIIGNVIGSGASGIVAAAVTEKGPAAVKKIHNVFDHPVNAFRVLRELRIQSRLQHDNILAMRDIMTIPKEQKETFNDVYAAFDLMGTNLYSIIRSAQVLTDDHHVYILYQVFKGLAYLHSANVIHRDLKPANILVNVDTTVRLADFGLATALGRSSDVAASMMAYVQTRFYRAPEVIMERNVYETPVDIWSAGCVLAELILRRPLLPGSSELNQLHLILDMLGKPSPEAVARIGSTACRRHVENYECAPFRPLRDYFPSWINPLAMDLLEQLLVLDPSRRLTAQEALAHPYFARIRRPETEVLSDVRMTKAEVDAGAEFDVDTLRNLIFAEALRHHPEEMGEAGPPDASFPPAPPPPPLAAVSATEPDDAAAASTDELSPDVEDFVAHLLSEATDGITTAGAAEKASVPGGPQDMEISPVTVPFARCVKGVRSVLRWFDKKSAKTCPADAGVERTTSPIRRRHASARVLPYPAQRARVSEEKVADGIPA